MSDIPNGLLQTSSIWFQDDTGRTLLLRGVNLSGSVKCPHGHPQHQADDFWASAEDGAELTWVNNPLNLDDGSADVHLARLRAWGWNTLRFVFTWEAIEHAGPKRYDTDYIAYVVAVLRRCGEFGFRVFMDPHQDVWSRFSGGSGAPIWTFHAANLQPRNFPTTYSALLQPFYSDPTLPADTKPDAAQFPAMIWSTNHDRLANLTMWTLFFGGRDFAPHCIIDGINIQDWLHAHYLGAIDALATAIASADSGNLLDRVVIGWDSLNEPAEGLIGRQNLSEVDHSEGKMHKGPTTSPLQEFNLGMGRRVNQAEYWVVGSLGPSQKGKVDLDPNGTKVWMEEEEDDALSKKWGYTRGSGWKKGLCIWAQHGVWDLDTSAITKPDYFRTNPTRGVEVDFEADYWLPHFTDYLKRVRRHHARAIAFIQPPVFHIPPAIPADLLQGRACYAPHFYDGLTLITRHWWWFNADPVGLLRNKYATLAQAISLGEGRVRQSLAGSLRQLKDDVNRFGSENKMPTLIGEIGIPFDLDDRKAYGFCEGGIGQGDYTNQQRALDASLSATDNTNILNWTMWTYCPDNSHEYGDQWNMEDLSVWSTDDLIAGRTPSEDSTDRSFSGSTASSTATSFQQLGEQRTVSSPTGKPAVASSASSADCQRYVNRVSPEIVRQGSRIPPELLIDGTRAVGAFCRPYAVATVGRPTKMTFDIRTSQFKLEVEVDSASAHGPQVYTEIFVPYVHYAKDGNRMSLDAASSRPTSGPIHAKVKHDVNKSLSDGIIEPLSLDISVSVSDGTYETHGQYLRWWYDVPTATSVSTRTYTIVIARNGGPIPARMEQSIPSWSDLCPIGQSSCNVM